jgi:NADP-dependent 3-hydroxy acid dehydrogenase YdfG
MDKAALVTGGSSGIGFAIASMLRENGFALTLAARTQAKVDAAAETLGAYGVVADVAQDADCRRLDLLGGPGGEREGEAVLPQHPRDGKADA